MGSPRGGGDCTVTLEVNSRQVAALQLALTRGSMGLAMRNPLDKDWNPMEPMVVKEGQLTAASEALDPATLALFGRIQQMLTGTEPTATPPAPSRSRRPTRTRLPSPLPVAGPPVPEYFAATQQKRAWAMTITEARKSRRQNSTWARRIQTRKVLKRKESVNKGLSRLWQARTINSCSVSRGAFMRGAGRKVPVTAHSILWLVTVVTILGSFGTAMAASDPSGEEIVLIVGRSVVIRTPWPTVRVAVTDPKIANVEALTPEQVLVQGLSIGTTDLILWAEGEQQSRQQRVVVKMDLEAIRLRLQQLFPTAQLQLTDAGEVLVLQGLLRSADDAEQLSRYLETAKLTNVNMTSVAGVQQVQLQVRVAEVSRQALRSLGVNWFATGNDGFFGQRVGASGAGSIVPGMDIGVPEGTSATGDLPFQFLNDTSVTPGVSMFAGFPRANLEVFIQALAENQYLRILANPTLVALSGEQADFLAGGEFPIPVVQSGARQQRDHDRVQGIRRAAELPSRGPGRRRHPVAAMQEVSQLTDVGAVVVQGFQVPALVTRRAEATLELQSGQSFAMAGLLQRTDNAVTSRIPGLGDLPVLGPLFRSVRYRQEETELVILVTASLVEPLSLAQTPPLPGATHTAPDDWELYLEGRIHGRQPAKLDPASTQWLKDMGLDQLVGPGAWATYGESCPATESACPASAPAEL